MQGLELRSDTGGKSADGDVANVTEEVLNTNLLGLFCLDD